MDINLAKYFKPGDIEESDDEEFVPEEPKPRQLVKRHHAIDKAKWQKYIKGLNERLKEEQHRRMAKINSEKQKSSVEITKNAKLISKQIIEAQQKHKKKSTRIMSFADRLYYVIDETFLQEIDKKPEQEAVASDNQALEQSEDKKQELLDKITATKELLKNLNHLKHVKLTSILKSKYDWKKFISSRKLEDNMNYHRKDDMIFKKLNILDNN